MPDLAKMACYIARTRRNQEREAAKALAEMTVFLPLRSSRVVLHGKMHLTLQPLLPGYVFVLGDMTDEVWHRVVDGNIWRGGDPGPVIGFLGATEYQAWSAQPDTILDWIKSKCDDEGVWIEDAAPQAPRFNPGDRVQIMGIEITGDVRSDDGRWCVLRLPNGWPMRVASGMCEKISDPPAMRGDGRISRARRDRRRKNKRKAGDALDNHSFIG